jgi:hypothetical protein
VAPGECLMRTSRLEPYSDWTFYDGAGFVPSGGSPYDQKPPHLPCKPVVGLSGEVGSIGKLADTHLFVAFMIASHADVSLALRSAHMALRLKV